MPCYPIQYRQIETQYAFFTEKQADGRYKVRVHATRDLKDQVFATRAEADKYINQKQII